MMGHENIDTDTVESFGAEWAHFDQTGLVGDELRAHFERYFGIFPWDELSADAEGFDMGCGSGRWAALVAGRVGVLNCIDPAKGALDVAKGRLAPHQNVRLYHAGVETAPLVPRSQDFGYSLGVLHHIPDTAAALDRCVSYLRSGAPFLVYLYYRFDNRLAWFRAIWSVSNLLRRAICRLPETPKRMATDLIALAVYWPLSRLAKVLETLGLNPSSIPLAYYRNASLYTLRTDSRDRFGTPLEQRFTKDQIRQMMENAGLEKIEFSPHEPYWVAVGRRRVDG